MTQPLKENPRAVGAAGGLRESNGENVTINHSKVSTPRQQRLLLALRLRELHREEVDRIAGTSNGPDVVAQLREKGWDIPCRLVEHIDRDGRKGHHGVYSLSPDDRQELREWLSERGAG